MARWLAACLVAISFLWVAPAPADDPEVPEKYVSVDQVNTMLDQKKPMTLIDVRPKDQFDELHIRGARNIPLTELPQRLASISKNDYTVLY